MKVYVFDLLQTFYWIVIYLNPGVIPQIGKNMLIITDQAPYQVISTYHVLNTETEKLVILLPKRDKLLYLCIDPNIYDHVLAHDKSPILVPWLSRQGNISDLINFNKISVNPLSDYSLTDPDALYNLLANIPDHNYLAISALNLLNKKYLGGEGDIILPTKKYDLSSLPPLTNG
nr:hypothetical protein [Abalone asfa-like virus]